MKWTEALNVLEQHLRAQHASENTVRAYLTDLRQFADAVGTRPERVRWQDVERFISSYEGATAQRKLAAIRALYRLLVRNGYATADPTTAVRAPKAPRRLPLVVSEQAVSRVWTVVSRDASRTGRLKLAALSLLLSGLRASEVCNVRLGDVDLDAGTVRVRGKGDKDLVYYLAEAQRLAVEEWLKARGEPGHDFLLTSTSDPWRPLYPRALARIVEEFSRIAGERFTPHSFRHRLGTRIIELGGTPFDAQRALNHETISTTQRYVHLAATRMQEIVGMVNEIGGPYDA